MVEIAYSTHFSSLTVRFTSQAPKYLRRKLKYTHIHRYTIYKGSWRSLKTKHQINWHPSFANRVYSLCAILSIIIIKGENNREKNNSRSSLMLWLCRQVRRESCWYLLNTIFRLHFFVVLQLSFVVVVFGPSLFFPTSGRPTHSQIDRESECSVIPVKYHFVFSCLTLRKFICE